jgi:hypothetical protein
MPGDTVIDCTGGAGGFAVGVLMNGCHLICCERDLNQSEKLKLHLTHLESTNNWKMLMQPITVPEVFMKKNKQDVLDLLARKKTTGGTIMTEKDIRWFPSPELLTSAAPSASAIGAVRDWLPARYRSQEIVKFCFELQKAWEKVAFLRVSTLCPYVFHLI